MTKILVPGTVPADELRDAMTKIETWGCRCIGSSVMHEFGYPEEDYWLGSSGDGQTWGFAATAWSLSDDDTYGFPPEAIVAFLVNPPKRNDDTIAEILFRIHMELKTSALVDNETLKSIIKSVPFPLYPPVCHYLPQAPESWLSIPSELVVGFDLSEGSYISDGTFRDYNRGTVNEALSVLYEPRHVGLLIRYAIAAREVTPLLSWNVDWPLSRQGKLAPYRREKVQGPMPWDTVADQKFLVLYQSVPNYNSTCAPHHFAEPVVHLVVGGRSKDEAISNWYLCAKELRTRVREIKANRPTQPNLR